MDPKLSALLPHLMRPPGAGIPAFSAGKESASEVGSILYKILFAELYSSSAGTLDQLQVTESWKETWKWIGKAKTVLIGVPTDTGAGIRRGAAYGPRGIRREIYKLPEFVTKLRNSDVLDLGDLYVNPHLLHDSMLSEEQKDLCRKEMYPDAAVELRAAFPVSVLSQLKLILSTLTKAYPNLNVQIIGGDHSVAWPVTEVLAKKFGKTFGIVQPDAHTDLLPSRLGVKYCFGTWSYHANELLGKNGRLVQVGVRQSGKNRQHWESTLGVRQYWADEIRKRQPAEVITEIIEHLQSKGIREVYFSNDIDGTDESEAPATGTPASAGVSSQFFLELIQALKRNFHLVASDVVEVAPDLASPNESQKTCALAAKYLLSCLD